MHWQNLVPYILSSLGVFVTALLLGYQLADISPNMAGLLVDQLREKFSPLADASPLRIFGYIFVNNTLIDLGMILSFFLFGLAPFFILFSNGVMIGIVISAFGKEQGLAETTTLLIPHGILEIPAFLIAAGTGIWLSVQFAKRIFKKQAFRDPFTMAVKVFFLVIVPLNFLAAFVETYITPLLYSWRFPQ